MYWKITKLITTTILIVLVSEVSKRSIIIGGLIAALPLVSILSMIWMQCILLEGVDLQIINEFFTQCILDGFTINANAVYVSNIFSILMGFNIAFSVLIGFTILFYVLLVSIVSRWGVNFSI